MSIIITFNVASFEQVLIEVMCHELIIIISFLQISFSKAFRKLFHKWKSFKMDNIYTTFRPFYFILKIFGGFPKCFVGPARKGVFKQRFVEFIIPSLWCSLTLIIFVLIVTRDTPVAVRSSFLVRGWNYILFFCLLINHVAFWYQIVKRNSIAKFLRLIDSIDKKVKKI